MKVFKGRKNQKQPLELFWEKEMFLKIAVPKVNRPNLQSKFVKNTYKVASSFLVKLQSLSL